MDESPGCVPDLRSPGDLAEEPADDLSSGARCRHRRQTWENHGKSQAFHGKKTLEHILNMLRSPRNMFLLMK